MHASEAVSNRNPLAGASQLEQGPGIRDRRGAIIDHRHTFEPGSSSRDRVAFEKVLYLKLNDDARHFY